MGLVTSRTRRVVRVVVCGGCFSRCLDWHLPKRQCWLLNPPLLTDLAAIEFAFPDLFRPTLMKFTQERRHCSSSLEVPIQPSPYTTYPFPKGSANMPVIHAHADRHRQINAGRCTEVQVETWMHMNSDWCRCGCMCHMWNQMQMPVVDAGSWR